MDRTNDFFTLIGDLRADMKDLRADMKDLRADMNRQFADVRGEISGLRVDTNRRFEALDQKVDRDFRWLVGIQMTVMLTVIGLLVGTLYR